MPSGVPRRIRFCVQDLQALRVCAQRLKPPLRVEPPARLKACPDEVPEPGLLLEQVDKT
jgi:hypothetical protein